MEMNNEEEREFNRWLGSIQFVDEDSNILPIVLTVDESLDPEFDRGED